MLRYGENRDSSSITYKKWNQTPRDLYPTYSFCFEGAELIWHRAKSLFDRFGINAHHYSSHLKGENAGKHIQNNTQPRKSLSRVLRNISRLGFEQNLFLDSSDIVHGLEHVAENINHTIHYGIGQQGKKMLQPPFEIGFQAPDLICFTRVSNDHHNSVRLHDWFKFHRRTLEHETFKNTEMKVFIHYPGQLMRSFDNPAFHSKLGEITWWRQYLFRISHVTVLRKRPDSNVPCNPELYDDDEKLKQEIIKEVKCIPLYWNDTISKEGVWFLSECESAYEHAQLNDLIANYKDIMLSYQPPCASLSVLTTHEKRRPEHQNYTVVKFEYKDRFYQEIENTRAFSFESFWSAVGGFVGIFIGYSLQQLPDSLLNLLSFFRNLKNAHRKNIHAL